MSSTIASVRMNGFRPGGAWRAARTRTPSANAMSVAIGIPHPSTPSPPVFNARKISAGATMPPIAPIAGEELTLHLETDHEEEQRHQAVVHPVTEVLGDRPVADDEAHLGPPDPLVRVAPRRVRPHQS